MAKIKGTIVVDKERCKGCGVCVASCPCDVLELSAEVNSKGYPISRMVNPDACTGCASCAVICPDSVITVYRQNSSSYGRERGKTDERQRSDSPCGDSLRLRRIFRVPITPQSEVMETLMELKPWETTGMVVLQAESEISSINMVYGGASTGKRVMTSSSSPGISLMSEGLSYLAGAELPCLVINCQRGGPGLGTIQPSQGDYFQACKGGGHGDFHMIVLAPNSVQEMHDHVAEAFDLAFKYRNPAMILADGAIGQMMEKVVLAPQRPRKTDEEIAAECRSWAAYGKPADRKRNIVTSLELQSEKMEIINKRLQEKYKALEENEVRYEEIGCDDADYVIVAFGSSARICSATVEMARAEGLKVGLLRPITLYPFPKKPLAELAARGVKGFLSAELNAGQMVEDVRLAVNGVAPVEHFGRQGGMMFAPDEVLAALKEKLIKK